MNTDLKKEVTTSHPCENHCPHYRDEPCAHCMIDVIRLNKCSIDSIGDDEYIENHVSPQCVIGGDV